MSVSDEDIAQIKQIDLRNIIHLEDEKDYHGYKGGFCPFHESASTSANPSFLVFPNGYRCLSPKCEESGNIFNWFSYILWGDPHSSLKNGRFVQVVEEILGTPVEDKKREPRKIKLVNRDDAALFRLAKAYYRNLLKRHPEKVTYFMSRGFTLDTICRQMWGWDGEKYVITVWEGKPGKSRLEALRMRREDTGDKELDSLSPRYSGIEGYNDKTLYNREALLLAIKNKSPYLLMVYGEFDAQLAWQDGIYAVSPTNGAKSLDSEWFRDYQGMKFVMPDKGEEKEALQDAEQFGSKGRILRLPRGRWKDYSEFRLAGGEPDTILKLIKQEI